jgi:RimJ/RimL family protein N-acetyltransferase
MLKTFEEPDFPILQNWVTSPELLFQFSAVELSYPLSLEQWQSYRQKYPDRRQYLAMLDDGAPYAFGEIIPQDEKSVRLSRLLIGEALQRGKGLGGRLIKELVEKAVRQFAVERIDLFVLADNQGAIRCYEKAGFEFVEAPLIELEFESKKYPVRKMSYPIR